MERTKIPAPKDEYTLGLMEINGRSLNQCYLRTPLKPEVKASIDDLFRAEGYMHRVAKEALSISCASSQITELLEEEHKENPPLIITNARVPRKKRKNADDEILQEFLKKPRTELKIADIAANKDLILLYIIRGEVETLETLINQNHIDVNQEIRGQSLLHHAMSGNYALAMATMLLEHGAKVNSLNVAKSTPLHVACHKSNIDVLRLLLFVYNARIDIQNRQGSYPIHLLTSNMRTEALKILLERDPYKQIGFTNKKGQTALDLVKEKTTSTSATASLLQLYDEAQKKCPLLQSPATQISS